MHAASRQVYLVLQEERGPVLAAAHRALLMLQIGRERIASHYITRRVEVYARQLPPVEERRHAGGRKGVRAEGYRRLPCRLWQARLCCSAASSRNPLAGMPGLGAAFVATTDCLWVLHR